MVRFGMIIDLKRCIGCDACTLACKAEQGTPRGVLFSRVYRRLYGKYPNVKGFFLPILCNHCEDPACMKACPSHAIYKTPEGIVVIDEDRCTGARACVAACPYGAIFFPEGDGLYFPGYETPYEAFHRKYRKKNTAMKCDFCLHRLRRGMEPACVAACPAEARIFGDLDDPGSKPNKYLRERFPRVEPKPLRPEAGTRPKVLYLL